jgi:tetratricopeptide (TPR) repeat protein
MEKGLGIAKGGGRRVGWGGRERGEKKMGVKEWLYEECPCGSGKKLKFCCWREIKGEVSDGDGHDHLVEAVRNLRQPEGLSNAWSSLGGEAEAKATIAMNRMQEGKYREAAEGFRKARKAQPGMYAVWNNEAMALWLGGKREEGRKVMEEGLERSGAVNAFGWGLLSEMRHALGDAAGAAEAADRASALVPATRDAASKTAAALSLLGRDEEVLRYVAGCGFEGAKIACLHAGVAAANLGRRAEALEWLERAHGEHGAMDKLAEKIAEDLESGTRAEELPEGRWPHWNRSCYDLGEKVQTEAMACFGEGWEAVACDVMSMALYGGTLRGGDALALLRHLKGPCAEAMRGRLEANGAKEPGKPPFATREEAREFFIDAVLRLEGMSYQTIEFTDEVPEEDPIGEEDLEAYREALEVLKKRDPKGPGWEAAKATVERLQEGHPKRYRERMNYASFLATEGKPREAEKILEGIFAEHPDYGHAAAAMLRIAVWNADFERGEEICRTYRPSKKMMPEEYLDWLDAQEFFLDARGEKKAAAHVRKIARGLRKDFGVAAPGPKWTRGRTAFLKEVVRWRRGWEEWGRA